MKLLIALPISLCFLLPTKILAVSSSQFNSICESFEAGKIDAHSTLKALELNIDDYSIGVNNTAKISCA